jgi:two-component system phosphate regulon sensor histidine kinase PhoR
MMGPRLTAYVATVVAAAAAAIVAAAALAGAPTTADLPSIVGYAAAFVLVQLLPVPFPRGRQLELVRVEEAVVVPLVLLVEPAAALLAVGGGVLAGQLLQRRPSPVKVAFNAAQLVLATSAALLVVERVTGAWAPGASAQSLAATALGLVAMFVVNQLLVAGVMHVASGVAIGAVLRDDLALKAAMWAANASIGMLLVLPAQQRPALAMLAFVPLVMLHAAWRVHADRARDEQRLRELGDAVGGMSGEVPADRVASALAESARDVVDAVAAQVRLRDGSGTWWSVRREGGDVERGSGRAGALVPLAPGARRTSLRVPLAGSDGELGELEVWAEPREAAGRVRSPFTRRDRTLLELLAHQAATALENSVLTARSQLQQRTIAQVFDHSSEGMLVLDRRGRVCGWNPAMRTMSGFDEPTVTESPISLISPQLAGIVEQHGPGTLDATLSTADGEHRLVRASFAPIDSPAEPGRGGEGAEPSWVVVVRDVTLEQETERLKDDFVATVSHELRTPLTAIKGFLETMRRDDIQLGEGQVRMFLQIMGEQADRLERLIGDLLDMSAIESGRQLEVECVPVDLSTSVRRALRAFTAGRPEAVVELSDDYAGVVVEADSHRLEQVVCNLLDNAVKHGGAASPVAVAITRSDQRTCTIEVRDDGPGISAVDQRRIFERFYVTSDSVTRAGGGAGLGLYICQQIVAAMGGSIGVESSIGQGTTFRVTLPVVAETLRVADGLAAKERPRARSDL